VPVRAALCCTLVRAFVTAVLVLGLAALAGCEPARASASAPSAPYDPAAEAARDAFRRPDQLVALLGLHPGDRVADVGAGDGYLSFRLAAAVGASGRVVATDVDLAALLRLCARAVRTPSPAAAAAVEPRLVEPRAPALEAHAFDVVLLAQVDHYLDDRVADFRALLPALAPGGRLILANRTPHLDAALAAAAAAGYVLHGEPSLALPGQFVAVFVPQESP
jgi:predicted methyltransferase